jgi:hypothetical protein
VECFVNLMSCLEEERETVREDAAMGLNWDRKRSWLLSLLLCRATPKSGDDILMIGTFRQHANFIYPVHKKNPEIS